MLFYVQIFQDQASYGISDRRVACRCQVTSSNFPYIIPEMMNTAM